MALSPDEAHKLIEDGAQLIDVRTEHEWNAGRIGGAVRIGLGEIAERVGEIDRGRLVVFYCRGDNRSDMAAEALGASGYVVETIAGGIVGWAGAGLPLEPEEGYVAESGEAAAILAARKKIP
jgi:rhodanese-related sulfurtransferase